MFCRRRRRCWRAAAAESGPRMVVGGVATPGWLEGGARHGGTPPPSDGHPTRWDIKKKSPTTTARGSWQPPAVHPLGGRGAGRAVTVRHPRGGARGGGGGWSRQHGATTEPTCCVSAVQGRGVATTTAQMGTATAGGGVGRAVEGDSSRVSLGRKKSAGTDGSGESGESARAQPARSAWTTKRHTQGGARRARKGGGGREGERGKKSASWCR